jgi:enamine deaminase RidA (YjgF/YER057c/UK114 family)
MEESMPGAPDAAAIGPAARLRKLGLVLPKAPTPLGNYIEANQVGSLLFLSGTIPFVDGKLAFSGRLGENLSVEQGKEAARLAALNTLALVQEHVGDLNRVKRVVKLIVLMVTTESFTEHPAVGDGASDLFAQLFGPETGHVRVVYGVQSMPIGAPVMVDAVFEVAV